MQYFILVFYRPTFEHNGLSLNLCNIYNLSMINDLKEYAVESGVTRGGGCSPLEKNYKTRVLRTLTHNNASRGLDIRRGLIADIRYTTRQDKGV